MGLTKSPGGEVDEAVAAAPPSDELAHLLRTIVRLAHQGLLADEQHPSLDLLNEAYVVVGRGGEVRAWNRAGRALLDAATNLDEVIAGGQAERVRRHRAPDVGVVRRLPLHGGGHVDAYVLLEQQSSERHVLLQGEILASSGDDELPRRRATDRRVGTGHSELTKVQEDLLAVAIERLEELSTLADSREAAVHVFAHDLHSPLVMMASLLDHLAGSEDQGSRTSERMLLREVAGGVRSTLEVVRGITDFVAMEHGAIPVGRDLVDVATIVKQAVADAGPGDVHLMIDPEDTVVWGDGVLLERAVFNLVSNALGHGRGARVDVRVASCDEEVTVSVSDRGPGVPNELKSVIFKPLCRGASADGGGLGLGLALVDRIAHLHGGYTWVQDREGGGACFLLTLSRHGGATRQAPDAPVRGVDGRDQGYRAAS